MRKLWSINTSKDNHTHTHTHKTSRTYKTYRTRALAHTLARKHAQTRASTRKRAHAHSHARCLACRACALNCSWPGVNTLHAIYTTHPFWAERRNGRLRKMVPRFSMQ